MDHILYWNDVTMEANRRDFSNVAGINQPMPEHGWADAQLPGNGHRAPRHVRRTRGRGGQGESTALPCGAHVTRAWAPTRRPQSLPPRMPASPRCSRDRRPSSMSVWRPPAFPAAASRRTQPSVPRSQRPCSTIGPATRPSMDRATCIPTCRDGPRYGALSKLFAVTERHELEPPPELGSAEYKRGIEDVRGMGIAPHLMGTLPVKFRKRINDETLIGLFWVMTACARSARRLGCTTRSCARSR